MSESDHPTGPPESGPALTPFTAQVVSALDAAGIDWQQDDDGDLRVTVGSDLGKPPQVFFRTLEPGGERILLAIAYDVLPGVNTPALLPLNRTTVAEVLNWMHQHRLGVAFYVTFHNFVACKCAFPVYGRARREQVETMLNLILGAVHQVQPALHAALRGASLENALRLVAEGHDSGPENDNAET